MKYIFTILLLATITINAQWNPVDDIPRDVPVPGMYYDGTTAIACADSLIYISYDHGSSWIQSSNIGEADYIYTAAVYNGRIFVGTQINGVYESQDGGKTWIVRNDGFTGLGSETISKLELRGDYLYAGTMGAGVFVLDLKNSTTWQQYNNGLYFNYSYSVFSLKNINGRLFTGAGISAFYYVNDSNSSGWNEYRLDNFNSMVFYDFASGGSDIYSVGSLGLFTSRDGGKTFSFVNHNIGGVLNAGMSMHGSDIYLSFMKDLSTYWFKSSDSGYSLVMLEYQPYTFVLSTIVIGNKLYAGRVDGLWYRDLTTTPVEDEVVPVNFQLSQNYPNPFNPETVISYKLPESGNVQLKVYDVLGTEVANLIDEYQHSGTYNIKFESGKYGLASGVYFYRLQTGNFIETKKMTLLR